MTRILKLALICLLIAASTQGRRLKRVKLAYTEIKCTINCSGGDDIVIPPPLTTTPGTTSTPTGPTTPDITPSRTTPTIPTTETTTPTTPTTTPTTPPTTPTTETTTPTTVTPTPTTPPTSPTTPPTSPTTPPTSPTTPPTSPTTPPTSPTTGGPVTPTQPTTGDCVLNTKEVNTYSLWIEIAGNLECSKSSKLLVFVVAIFSAEKDTKSDLYQYRQLLVYGSANVDVTIVAKFKTQLTSVLGSSITISAELNKVIKGQLTTDKDIATALTKGMTATFKITIVATTGLYVFFDASASTGGGGDVCTCRQGSAITILVTIKNSLAAYASGFIESAFSISWGGSFGGGFGVGIGGSITIGGGGSGSGSGSGGGSGSGSGGGGGGISFGIGKRHGSHEAHESHAEHKKHHHDVKSAHHETNKHHQDKHHQDKHHTTKHHESRHHANKHGHGGHDD